MSDRFMTVPSPSRYCAPNSPLMTSQRRRRVSLNIPISPSMHTNNHRTKSAPNTPLNNRRRSFPNSPTTPSPLSNQSSPSNSPLMTSHRRRRVSLTIPISPAMHTHNHGTQSAQNSPLNNQHRSFPNSPTTPSRLSHQSSQTSTTSLNRQTPHVLLRSHPRSHHTSQTALGENRDVTNVSSAFSPHHAHTPNNFRPQSMKTFGVKKSYSEELLNFQPMSPPINSHRRTSSAHPGHVYVSNTHKRDRRPSYMRQTFTSEKRRWHVLQHGGGQQSDSSSEEEHESPCEFHPPIVLPPIWMTSAGKATPLQGHSARKVIPTITITTASGVSRPSIRKNSFPL